MNRDPRDHIGRCARDLRWNGTFGLLPLYLILGLGQPVGASETNSPRALAVGDTYRLEVDGFTNGQYEGNTLPRTDANDGGCIAAGECDNPYFQRNNITAAHVGGCIDNYWYTRTKATYPGEADPASPQWVDYKPPLTVLGPGRYSIQGEYRCTTSRATYPAQYIVHHTGGTTTISKSQRDGTSGACVSFELGTFDLGATGYVRVNDTGTQSITFNKMRFTYLGLSTGVPIVNAGPDQPVVLPASASLHGTATDDGLPAPLTTTWSNVSGPGTVTFSNVHGLDSTASFSAAGDYVLRLTATDTANTVSDDINITVLPVGGAYAYCTRYEFDAAPDAAAGVIDTNSSDANGAGLLVKSGNGVGDSGSIAGGILHFIDSTSSGSNGYYWAMSPAGSISYTVDMRVKVNGGVSGTTNRRSLGFSAGPNMNLGLRLHRTNDGSTSTCTDGSVRWAGGSGGTGTEGCVDNSAGAFHRFRVAVNAAKNTFHVYDLDTAVEIATASGGGGSTLSWASEINNAGGFHLGSISASYTTLTDYELDYFRVLLGTAVENATTVIQVPPSCGSSVETTAAQAAAVMIAGETPTPARFVYTVASTGHDPLTYTVQETGDDGDPLDYPWLSLDRTTGTIAALGSDTVVATLSSSGLTGGVYTAYLQFSDNCNPANVFIREIDLSVQCARIPADFDRDCDVDADDFARFMACATGEGILAVAQGCSDADLDGDADVDMNDFASLQRSYTGPIPIPF